jgi:hypothetical protein
MWDTLKPDALDRLPRTGLNGSVNGTHGTPKAAHLASWEKCLAKLDEFRSYGDDWDGQGAAFGKPAATITAELIDSAVALVEVLRRYGVVAPSYTFPDVQGGVGFDWSLNDGSSVTLEVPEPGVAEMWVYTADKRVEQVVLMETTAA